MSIPQSSSSAGGRQEELRRILGRVDQLLSKRLALLHFFEERFVEEVLAQNFSNLKKNTTFQEDPADLWRRGYELELRTQRRNIFYLRKRKQTLLQELDKLKNSP